MKTAIYTVNHNGYDVVRPIDVDCDCFLLTDDPSQQLEGWQTIHTEHPQREIKIYPWHYSFLGEYDILIYMDASLEMKKGSFDFIMERITESNFLTTKHPTRDCVFDEIQRCLDLKKDTPENLDSARYWLINNEMQANTGIISSAFIARKNLPSVRRYCFNWLLNHKDIGTRRDQISQAYTQFKTPYEMDLLDYGFTFKKLFTLHKHAKKEWK